jgi:hypothetical protein
VYIYVYIRIRTRLVRQEQEQWMDLTYIRDDGGGEEPNWRRWESSLTIAQKRVLATWWCGDAYAKLLTEPYQHALAAAWTKGGCDAGAPGFDISHVGIQGLHRPFSAYDGDVEAAYTHIRRIYIYIYISYTCSCSWQKRALSMAPIQPQYCIQDHYINDFFTGSHSFRYSDQLPGGDDQLGHDSDMPTSSSEDNDSSASSDEDEPSSPEF